MKRARFISNNSFGKNNRGIITVRGKQNVINFKSSRFTDNYRYIHIKLIRRFLFFSNLIKAKIVFYKADLYKNRFVYFIRFITGPFHDIYSYCPVSNNLYINDIIYIRLYRGSLSVGDIAVLCNVSEGSKVHNVSNINYSKSVFARSSNKSVCLLNLGKLYATVKLPSGLIRVIHKDVHCIYGELKLSIYNKISSAGDSRMMGLRPKVRGVAMNACDHPHGGGEGKSSIGRISIFSA